MGIEFEKETGESARRSAKSPRENSSEVEWLLTGTTDRGEAEAHAAANLPATDNGNVLDYFKIKELDDARDGSWKVTGFYKGAEGTEASSSSSSSSGGQPSPREIGFAFDIAPTSRRITHSKETIDTHTIPGETAPTTNNGINIQDGSPEGVDIHFSETSFSVEMEYPQGVIDNALIQAWESLAQPPHTNGAEFRGRSAGEVLFNGVRGNVKHVEDTNTVVFNFLVSKNVTNLKIASWEDITKKGWELAWIYQEERIVGDYKIAKPISLFIERVYDEGDFSTLGIPV